MEDDSPEQLRRIGIKLFELGGGELKSFLKGEIVELGRFNYGYQQVYVIAISHYGLSDLMNRLVRKSKLS